MFSNTTTLEYEVDTSKILSYATSVAARVTIAAVGGKQNEHSISLRKEHGTVGKHPDVFRCEVRHCSH